MVVPAEWIVLVGAGGISTQADGNSPSPVWGLSRSGSASGTSAKERRPAGRRSGGGRPFPPPERYLKLIEDDPEAFAQMGLALRQLGRLEEAIEARRKGFQVDPEDVVNPLRLGILLAVRGRGEESLKALRETFERSENPAPHYR